MPATVLRCLCDSPRFVPVFVYDAPSTSEVRFRFAANARYHREVLRCEHCGHFVSVHEMDASGLYEGDYVDTNYGDGGILAAFDRIVALDAARSDNAGRIRRILDFAASRRAAGTGGGRPPAILDVGSGLCVFLHGMKAAGWACTAIDRDARLVRHARDVVGVEALCGDIAVLEGLGPFDAVTFNKVLEHVVDPVTMLAASARHLRAGGFVYVEVPDGEAAAAEGADREEFTIDHLGVFSMTSLSLLATRAGFMAVEMERLREPSTKFTLRAFLVPRTGV